MSKKAGKLELGSEISLGGGIWIAKRKTETEGIVTLALKTSLKNMEFDEAEPGNPDELRADYGNNDYELSNIRQWLNSRGNDWFRKQHEYDAPPEDYEYTNGFLTDFTEKELDAIKKLENGDLFYLPSVDEVDLVTGDEFDKGWVRTRTPSSSYSSFVRIVNSSGALYFNNAYNGNFGVRPLCNLSSETELEKVDGVWRVIKQPKTGKKKKNKKSKRQKQEKILRKAVSKWGICWVSDDGELVRLNDIVTVEYFPFIGDGTCHNRGVVIGLGKKYITLDCSGEFESKIIKYHRNRIVSIERDGWMISGEGHSILLINKGE